jgi:GxxExxY protein
MHYNQISGAIVDSAMKVHSALGPGLLESVYLVCLVHELNQREFRTAVQVPLPVIYDGVRLDLGFRLDVLVESLVVVEIKAVRRNLTRPSSSTADVSQAQQQASRPVHQSQ